MGKTKRIGKEFRDYFSKIGGLDNVLSVLDDSVGKQAVEVIGKDRLKVYGSEFYNVIKGVKGDIDDACADIFGDLGLPKYTKAVGDNSSKTRLENYLEQFIVKQKDIAEKIGTDSTSLNRFIKGVREIFAYQVYFIAKAFNRKPSEVFEFLYGNDKK